VSQLADKTAQIAHSLALTAIVVSGMIGAIRHGVSAGLMRGGLMLEQESVAKVSRSTLISDLMVLFKVRIVVLLLLAALGGIFLGALGWPGVGPLLLIISTGALTAMGSSAWNQYLERDTDALMTRTRTKRPLVNGAISRPGWVPYVATAMIVLPVLTAAPFNPALAFFLAAGAFIYVVIYTIWLKPRTNLNIVIGGLAGSAAVLSGGAAVSAWRDPAVVALAVMLFFWTPIHFWALALVYREDYARAHVPMLPVTDTPRRAASWGLVHGIGAASSGLVIAFLPGMGWIYAIPVGIAAAALLWQGAWLVADPVKKRAWRLFHTSNLYLAVVLVAAIVAAVV
jgi:protoheme IX farnesyltransferase